MIISVFIAVAVVLSIIGLRYYYLNNFYYDKAEDFAGAARSQVISIFNAEID